MKPFIDQDFLLSSDTAKTLFHNFAEKMPILDYHCHIDPKDIAKNRKFENITQIWLSGDHYKWRQLRSNGVEEFYITGEAGDREKFQKWAETLPKLIGNPLYHWSHMELQRYFDYHGVLDKDTAEEVWKLCNERLKDDSMSARNLIKRSGVTLLCTTDDPVDSLTYHKELAEDPDFDVKVLPTWRPDRAMNIEKTEFSDYMLKLSSVSNIEIKDFESLKAAIKKRMDFFKKMGCAVSDHGLEYVMYSPAPDNEIDRILKKGLGGQRPSEKECSHYKTALLLFMAREYHRLNWVLQLHYSCRRNNNSAMFRKLGPDTGFDCIDNSAPISPLSDFLSALSESDEIPKTIIYSLNPNDNAAVASVIGCFQGSGTPGKIQQGSAWWFNDHKAGMIEQMTSLANLGVLGNFIGMLTDSRSLLSYTRHEYFRRILCDLIGGWVENGEYPDDKNILRELIEGICFRNAKQYFEF